MKPRIRSNAKLTEMEFTLDRAKAVQEYCDMGWSFDRISANVDISKHTINKWIKAGLIKVTVDFNKKRRREKQVIAKEMLRNKVDQNKIADKLGVHPSTITVWKREGKIT